MEFILFPQNPYVEAKPHVVAVGDRPFQGQLGFREVRRPDQEDPACVERSPRSAQTGAGDPGTSLLVLRLGLRPLSGYKRVSVWGPQPVRVLGRQAGPAAPRTVSDRRTEGRMGGGRGRSRVSGPVLCGQPGASSQAPPDRCPRSRSPHSRCVSGRRPVSLGAGSSRGLFLWLQFHLQVRLQPKVLPEQTPRETNAIKLRGGHSHTGVPPAQSPVPAHCLPRSRCWPCVQTLV